MYGLLKPVALATSFGDSLNNLTRARNLTTLPGSLTRERRNGNNAF
jgi:hypothetical protein